MFNYKEKLKEIESKLREYRLTDEAVRLASFIVLDGVVCKDRWDFTKRSYIGVTPMDVTNTNIIIGYHGRLIYTQGQEGVPNVPLVHQKRIKE